MNTKSS